MAFPDGLTEVYWTVRSSPGYWAYAFGKDNQGRWHTHLITTELRKTYEEALEDGKKSGIKSFLDSRGAHYPKTPILYDYKMPRDYVIIKNWAIMDDDIDNDYLAPELHRKYLTGKVFRHPKHIDGTEVSTGHLKLLDWNFKVATTKHTTYLLTGPPNSKYLEWVKINAPDLLENIL